MNDEGDTAKEELKKSLADRKEKVIPCVLEATGNEAKSQVNGTSEVKHSESLVRSYTAPPRNQLRKPEQTQSKLENRAKKPVVSPKPTVSTKPVVPAKPVTQVKPSETTKPTVPAKPVPTKPVLSDKPVETIKPVKPEITKKPQAPPPKPKPYAFHLAQNKSDSNNNLNKNNQKQNVAKDSPQETPLLRNLETESREEESRKIPRGFSNILSSFESNAKDEKPLDVLYAKPDMSKKTPKQLTPVENVPVTLTCPRSDEMNRQDKQIPPIPSREQDEISSPYTDPGPPSFKPPPPPISPENQQDSRQAFQTASEPPKSEPKPAPASSLTPPPQFLSGSPRYTGLGLDEADDFKGNQRSLLVSPAVDLSYSSVDVVTSIPQKPVDNLDYEDVEPRFTTPPPKPAPYKSQTQAVSAEKQLDTITTGSTADRGHDKLKDDDFVLGSPRQPIAGSGSLRLSSAQLVANALKAPIPSELKNLSDSQGMDTRGSKTESPPSPSVNRWSNTSFGAPYKPKPPPPPRSSSIKDLTKSEPDTDIDQIIARALSPDMKPKLEIDDIPVRDTDISLPQSAEFSPKSDSKILNNKVLDVNTASNSFGVVPPPSWYDIDSVPTLDMSEFDLESCVTPPPPPSDPPPSLPIHNSVNLDMSSYEIDGLVNGCNDEDSIPPPPLPPSDKYTLDERTNDDMMKPLVPPLRKFR